MEKKVLLIGKQVGREGGFIGLFYIQFRFNCNILEAISYKIILTLESRNRNILPFALPRACM